MIGGLPVIDPTLKVYITKTNITKANIGKMKEVVLKLFNRATVIECGSLGEKVVRLTLKLRLESDTDGRD